MYVLPGSDRGENKTMRGVDVTQDGLFCYTTLDEIDRFVGAMQGILARA